MNKNTTDWERAWEACKDEITDVGGGLFLSAVPRANDLRDLGIKNVLNVAREQGDNHLCYGNFNVAHFFIEDGVPMNPMMVRSALKTLREMHRKGSTVVHCGMGVSRSPTIIALYWYARGEVDSLEEGIEILQRVRPCVSPNYIVDKKVMRAVDGLRRMWTKHGAPATIRIGGAE